MYFSVYGGTETAQTNQAEYQNTSDSRNAGWGVDEVGDG